MVQDKTPFCVSPKSFSWNWALDFLSSPGKNVSNSGKKGRKKEGRSAVARHLPFAQNAGKDLGRRLLTC
jgi:hypothetical protein